MAFTQVSRRWRAISLSTPRLWDHIQMTPFKPMPSLAFIREIVERSGVMPIHVELQIPLNLAPCHQSWHTASLEQVFLAFKGAQGIKLHMGASDLLSNLDPLGVSHVQQLWHESKKFRFSTSTTADASGMDMQAFLLGFARTARSLQTMYEAASDPSVASWASGFAWCQLTELDLSFPMNFLEARDILAQCTKMQKCAIAFHDHSDHTALPQRVIHLTELQHLDVNIPGSANPSPFFDAFALPSLTHLSLSSVTFSPSILFDLHEKSQFKLEELRLTEIEFWGEDLVPFLKLFPSLRILILELYGFDDMLFQAFTYDHTQPISLELPKLQYLSLISLDADDVRTLGEPVVRMAESLKLHPGSQNAAFPALVSVDLFLCGEEFESAQEDRLIAANEDTAVFTYTRIVV